MRRRDMIRLSAGTAAAALAAPAIVRAAPAPIRIGVLAPLTGVVAAGGKEMVQDFSWFWALHGNRAGARKVELLVEDDGSNPDTALAKARQLVEQSHVDMLVGDLLANTGLAVANYVKGTGTPYFIPIVAADNLTQRDRIPNVVRVAGYSASQTTHPFGAWAAQQGYKKIATISQDYTFGYEQCGGLAQTFTAAGGKITAQFWNPLNTADFSPYLGQLANAGVDAIFAMQTGADATRFIEQYASFGLKGKIPLLGSMNFTDQSVIRTMGPEVEGIVSAAQFAEGSANPTTQAYAAAHVKKFGTLPSLYGFAMYSAAMWIDEALPKIGDTVGNPKKLLAAVESTTLVGSPLGYPVTLDAYGNPIYTIFIRKVVKNPQGKWWNVPIHSYPHVSQFWTYNLAQYLKQPSYSRSFQGIAKT